MHVVKILEEGKNLFWVFDTGLCDWGKKASWTVEDILEKQTDESYLNLVIEASIKPNQVPRDAKTVWSIGDKTAKHKCNCDMFLVTNFGCKCGGV